jgi:hypothetical protein
MRWSDYTRKYFLQFFLFVLTRGLSETHKTGLRTKPSKAQETFDKPIE